MGSNFCSFLRKSHLFVNACLRGSENHAVNNNYQWNRSLREGVTNEGHGMAMELVAGSAKQQHVNYGNFSRSSCECSMTDFIMRSPSGTISFDSYERISSHMSQAFCPALRDHSQITRTIEVFYVISKCITIANCCRKVDSKMMAKVLL